MSDKEKLNQLKEEFGKFDGWIEIAEKSFYYISEEDAAEDTHLIGFYYDDEKICEDGALNFYEDAIEKLNNGEVF